MTYKYKAGDRVKRRMSGETGVVVAHINVNNNPWARVKWDDTEETTPWAEFMLLPAN